ncbi:Scr1 family TA system antitoxin-like transcriptional regulator [Streptomyces sp. NBC_01310]|uniref:Scr1 family TA system antitoxin-like transcriptional regulator n=1 Tax=Streptomyces sp. NBC_01310 TaxID=2903820 RepID=UPI0035B5B476|nr:Scr1 family TA system antitoxin-like transcriptional regulator [Streptomyces sp. NBC_01310]WSJ63844.1 Scr1 family TA system antitoxin-like transcriptional regulator [Streptomyces sp. NBC_01310]
MAANGNPTVRRRRLGAELRRLRLARGLTSKQVAKRLLISQPKISHLENGRRAIKPRDVRDLCGLYGITDPQVVDSLMRMATESNRQGWWVACGEVPYAVYIGLETEASSIRSYEPLVIPGLLQTPAYARAVIEETIPLATPEQIAARREVRLLRQSRAHHPARSFRLWVVLDESALRRLVGGPRIMREQLEFLNHLGAQPHITVQVLPHEAGPHPGVSGQFSILHFGDGAGAGTVYLERFTSDLYLEKRSDVQHYGVMYEHLQAQALSPERTRHFITRAAEELPASASLPGRP